VSVGHGGSTWTVIDDELPEQWPPEVLEACAKFKQGDVIEKPPFLYTANLAYPVWGYTVKAAKDSNAPREPVEVHPDRRPPYGLLTSQTCDIHEEGDPIMPWIQVVPVYVVNPDSRLLTHAHIVRLAGASFAAQNFVADLRIEFPLEKGELVGIEPIPGFATESEYLHLAEVLGRRRQRAALASEVNDIIRAVMRRKRSNNRNRWDRVHGEVHKVKLDIEDGTRLKPLAMRLYIVSAAPLSEDAHSWFEEWWDLAHEVAEENGLRLQQNGYLDQTHFDVALYDSLIEMDLNL
jgi:hypothetical protein